MFRVDGHNIAIILTRSYLEKFPLPMREHLHPFVSFKVRAHEAEAAFWPGTLNLFGFLLLSFLFSVSCIFVVFLFFAACEAALINARTIPTNGQSDR